MAVMGWLLVALAVVRFASPVGDGCPSALSWARDDIARIDGEVPERDPIEKLVVASCRSAALSAVFLALAIAAPGALLVVASRRAGRDPGPVDQTGAPPPPPPGRRR